MIHPNTELKFISPQKGYGVIATSLIPKGTITWVLDPLDQVFSSQRLSELEPTFKTSCIPILTGIARATLFYAGIIRASSTIAFTLIAFQQPITLSLLSGIYNPGKN
jgi:hypothetical protein